MANCSSKTQRSQQEANNRLARVGGGEGSGGGDDGDGDGDDDGDEYDRDYVYEYYDDIAAYEDG